MNIRVCTASFCNAEIPSASINQCKTIVTHNNFRHCRVHFYAYVRQPFSKQPNLLNLFKNLNCNKISSFNARGLKSGHISIFERLFPFLSFFKL